MSVGKLKPDYIFFFSAPVRTHKNENKQNYDCTLVPEQVCEVGQGSIAYFM
jgi:hypothetical protein